VAEPTPDTGGGNAGGDRAAGGHGTPSLLEQYREGKLGDISLWRVTFCVGGGSPCEIIWAKGAPSWGNLQNDPDGNSAPLISHVSYPFRQAWRSDLVLSIIEVLPSDACCFRHVISGQGERCDA
jgi:hypothetical protein